MNTEMTAAQLDAAARDTLEAFGLYPCDDDSYEELVKLVGERITLVGWMSTMKVGGQGWRLCSKEIVKVEERLVKRGVQV